MSPAYGRDTATFHFTWIDDLDAVLPAMRAVEDLLMPLDARPHWAKLTGTPSQDIILSYPLRSQFEQLTRELDPLGKFRNHFVDALFPRAK